MGSFNFMTFQSLSNANFFNFHKWRCENAILGDMFEPAITLNKYKGVLWYQVSVDRINSI